jgi:regulator of sirC expression with transglutaminase-like and TPR domain
LTALERFAELARLPEAELDLDRAALAIAAGADPELDPKPWLRELDGFAVGITDCDELCNRLFVELGFRGNQDDYYDPANSLLDRVIERRLGIPISLAMLMMEVGRRAGLDFQGVGLPGHFIVRDVAGDRLLDPFRAGIQLSEAECEALFRTATGAGPEVEFQASFLDPVGKHHMLARMLANLKELYTNAGEAAQVEWVVRMRLCLPGMPASEVVDLGEALSQQGRTGEGASEIQAWAASHPDAAQGLIAAARALRARLN